MFQNKINGTVIRSFFYLIDEEKRIGPESQVDESAIRRLPILI